MPVLTLTLEILTTHQPDPLPSDIEKELDAKKMEIAKRLARSALPG
jgi:hypothetical protein